VSIATWYASPNENASDCRVVTTQFTTNSSQREAFAVELEGSIYLVSRQGVLTNVYIVAAKQAQDGGLAEVVLGGQLSARHAGLVVLEQLVYDSLVEPLGGAVDMPGSPDWRQDRFPICGLVDELPHFMG
jgi:hypothetical protein